MENLRFRELNDDELYILKRSFIEAQKYIYMNNSGNYSEQELNLMNKLLNEVIDNIKARDSNT